MDERLLNKSFVEILKSKVGDSGNIANVISDIVPLGREAVYRRLRGLVVFSFSEIVALSKYFGLSIDEIVGSSQSDSHVFELKSLSFVDTKNVDVQLLGQFLRTAKQIAAEPNSRFAHASNVLSPLSFRGFSGLAKLSTFKELCLANGHSKAIPFSELEEGEQLRMMRLEILDTLQTVNDVCYIFDKVVVQSLVNDIKYLHHAHFLTHSEVDGLKNELFMFFRQLEQVAISGQCAKGGKKVSVYVSNTNFQTNYSFLKASSCVGIISAFEPMCFVTTKSSSLGIVEQWVRSLRKMSTLISESGEIQRKEFFDRQKRLIDSL